MRQIAIQLYTAEELSPEAQEVARQKWSEYWDTNDSDAIDDMFKESLADAGLSELEPGWSLGYCQGDGVAFYGKVDLAELAAKQPSIKVWAITRRLLGHDLEGFEVEVNRIGSHYHHWNTMRTCVIAPDGLEAAGDELCKALDAVLVDLSREMEKAGYEEIEYRQSMECFLEAADANGWEYTEDGMMH